MSYDTFTELNEAYEQVQIKWRQGNIIGAYNDLCDIFSYRLLHSKLDKSDAQIIQTLADVSSILGEFETADKLLCGAIYLHEQAKRQFWADYARLRRILLCLDRGNLHQAQNLLQEMAPHIGDINNIEFSLGLLQWEEGCIWDDVNTEDKSIIFTELYLAMGRLFADVGQYGEAMTALQRGFFHANSETAPDLAKSSLLPIELTYAGVLIEKGNLEEAEVYLSGVRELVYQPQYIQHRLHYLELSGKLSLLTGNLGAGLEKVQQVQKLCSELRLQQGVLRANLNLAHILILLNQTNAAQHYLKETQVRALSIGNTHLAARAQLLLQLCHARSCGVSPVASVWEMRKRPEPKRATIEIQGKLDLSSQSPNYLAWFEDRTLAFQWYLSELNLEKANNLLTHIKNVFNTDSDLIRIQIRVLEGIFCYYKGTEQDSLDKIHRAHEILMEVSPQLEALHLKPELWQVQRIIIWCRTRLNYPLSQIEPLTASTNNLLEQMTSTLKQEDQVLYLLNKWTADEEYIATRINHLQRLQQKIKTANILQRTWLKLELIRSLNTLIEHIDRYKDTLAKRTTSTKETVPISNKFTSVWRRLITHPKDRVTLTFLILPDRALIIITGLLLFDFRVIPTTRLAVRNIVQSWYKNIEIINRSRDININSNDNNSSVEQKITHNLAKILQIPQILQLLPKHVKSLTIVPDDILHGFPFATITYKDKYLIEHYKLSISYESQAKHIKSSYFIKKAKALVVGISKGNKQFNSLLGVNRELERINDWLNRRKINFVTLHNGSAHKDAIIESISKVSLLHIACHGAFNASQPDQSGLVLIDEDGKQDILTLRELSQINLTKLRHVTLSCCWSADHFILPGRWIISLPETLWRSGTHSILGCLWEIDDKVAVSFMTSFYNYLDKFPRDEALRRTQLDCLFGRLSGCNIDTANPLFWAGFNLYGNYTAFKSRI